MSSKTGQFQADAATRSALDERLYILVGRSVKEIRITRVRWPQGKRWVALVIGRNGREVPLHEGGLHHQAAIVLRDAFPQANWSRAQDYDVATGVLREHLVRLPAGLRDGDR
ncbi:hypothetical protein [Streptomyces sp. NBC_00996]|uniref:hypothetical protein n=1 Tax=Streptomyces sp. NBC_00996 TaxID=2903710 RepID=UPI00386B7BC3|nr:hypothetical protein OG390_17460 [Streptomyces sp. NBC_00996]